MNYKDYKNTRDLVWEILIRERICTLPALLSALCRNVFSSFWVIRKYGSYTSPPSIAVTPLKLFYRFYDYVFYI